MARPWFIRFLPSRVRMTWHYRRGMTLAKLGKHAAALDDYSVIIEQEDVADNMLAMALYNRVLVYDAQGDLLDARNDLQRLLKLTGASERIKTEARRRVLRMDHKLARSDAAASSTGDSSPGSNHVDTA